MSTRIAVSTRIQKTFDGARAENRAALMPFITAGYPSLEMSGKLLDALVEGGADIIELGVPFSDPLADGATVQASSQKALDNGTTLADCIELVRAFRERGGDNPDPADGIRQSLLPVRHRAAGPGRGAPPASTAS